MCTAGHRRLGPRISVIPILVLWGRTIILGRCARSRRLGKKGRQAIASYRHLLVFGSVRTLVVCVNGIPHFPYQGICVV